MMNFSLISKEDKVAVVGASRDRTKWGFKVYEYLKLEGFKVFPVNPHCEKIDNDKCYSGLEAISEKPDAVVTIVPYQVTEKIVEQCKNLEITKIWMQPGSESDSAIEFCKNNNIKIVANACFIIKK